MLLNCGAGEDSWESLREQGHQTSQSQRKSTLNIYWKDWCWSWSTSTWPADANSLFIGKDPDIRKHWGQEDKGATEDAMFGWHHWFSGHEIGQTLGDCEGQGCLACYSPWGHKELDMTWWLNNNNDSKYLFIYLVFDSKYLE